MALSTKNILDSVYDTLGRGDKEDIHGVFCFNTRQ